MKEWQLQQKQHILQAHEFTLTEFRTAVIQKRSGITAQLNLLTTLGRFSAVWTTEHTQQFARNTATAFSKWGDEMNKKNIDFVKWAALMYLRQTYKQHRNTIAQKLVYTQDAYEKKGHEICLQKCREVIYYLDTQLEKYENEVTK